MVLFLNPIPFFLKKSLNLTLNPNIRGDNIPRNPKRTKKTRARGFAHENLSAEAVRQQIIAELKGFGRGPGIEVLIERQFAMVKKSHSQLGERQQMNLVKLRLTRNLKPPKEK